jgi:phage terminase large subunit-like protein
MAPRLPPECACGSRETPHRCGPRAKRVSDVFAKVLVHTKGRYARAPFKLARWQHDEIISPLFGTVEWRKDLAAWARQYRIGWIELARKNGKSELLAGIALTLLVADDEEGAEVYGAACDRDQARKVYDVAERMVELSPLLARRLKVYKQAKRIVDLRTGSYYETIAADAAGNLGHNPHGIVFDEVITQPSSELWDALRTGMGARSQPLMVAATTAGTDLSSFAATEHDYCARILEQPTLDPRRFVFMRNTPLTSDWREEKHWSHANPALGDFLSLEALRDEAREATLSPTKEVTFCQFRLNMWRQGATRFMPSEAWEMGAGLIDRAQLGGRKCYGGLDLAAVADLTSLCWYFPPDNHHERAVMVWRHWVPEAVVPNLDDITGGQFSLWAKAGWCTIAEGDVVDFEDVHRCIAADSQSFRPVTLGIDRWNSTATTNWLTTHVPKLAVERVAQTFSGLSSGMKEVMRQCRLGSLNHGGDPVARWCWLSVEVKADENENVRPVKPDRGRARYRIDAVPSSVMAIDGWLRRPEKPPRRAAGF